MENDDDSPGSSESTVSKVPGAVIRSPTYSDGSSGGLGQLGAGRHRLAAHEGVQVDGRPGVLAVVGHRSRDLDRAPSGEVRRGERVDRDGQRVALDGARAGGAVLAWARLATRRSAAAWRSTAPSGSPATGLSASAGAAVESVATTATRAGSSDNGRSMATTLAVVRAGPAATGRRPGRRLSIEFPLVSDAALPPLQMSDVQRSVADGAGPDRAGDRRARTAVPGGRPRARAGGWPGARRDARPAPQRPRLHHLGAARADRGPAPRLGRRGLGHGPGVRDHRLPQG